MGAEDQVLVQVDVGGAILLGDRGSLWYKGRKVPFPPGSADPRVSAQTSFPLPQGEGEGEVAETSLRTATNASSY